MPGSLAERLRERIRREGPISFADFMEAALYDPDEGYYTRPGGAGIGEGGDFVTSPSVSPAFAGAIARRFARDAADLPGALDFVELGAGEGIFLAEFARALERDSPDVFARVRLTAVEKSEAARGELARRGGIRVLAGAGELSAGSVAGWIFANELFDALPVARIRGGASPDGGDLEELRVGIEGDRFVWSAAPAPPGWRERLATRGISIEPGQVAEVRPGARSFHALLAGALARGRLVLFDYGHRARTLYHPLARRGGTLAVHIAGRRGGDPLDRPGAQDLTAHVDWDELLESGERGGLSNQGPIRQGRFLLESGIFDFALTDAEKWRAYRLVDPGGMGDEISVIVQSRAMSRDL